MDNIYHALMCLEGVTEVEVLDDCQGTIGVYVEGGQNEQIAAVISRYTYLWTTTLGDTPTKLYNLFTLWFYRDKLAFRAKFKEMFGKEFE